MSTNRIYIFFIGLALLFWNPLTYYFVYRNSPVFAYEGMFILFSIIFVAALVIIFLLLRNRFATKWKNPILSIAVLGIFFGILTVTNCMIGKSVSKEEEGLIFAPGMQVRYKSTEFDYTVSTNSMGLRDREFNPEKGNKFRILCFGDSWTIGWGVNQEETYPAQLEKYLTERGINAEVINCGQAGTFTTIYAKQMKKILPILKPDLVLVGVLQGDDLAQLYETDSSFILMSIKRESFLKRIKSCAKTFLHSSFSNIESSLKPPKKQEVVQYNWLHSATSVIKAFTHQQRIRFNTLEDTVQKLFKTGNLNPSLMHFYLNFPDRMTIFNDPNHPATRLSIRRMNRDLSEIKFTCDSNHSKLVFLNLPMSMFTGHQVIRTPSDIFDPYFVAHNKIDSVYQSISLENQVPYLEMTKHFIELPDKSGYFYKFDGHPNARGYREIATLAGEQILRLFFADEPALDTK